MTKPEDVDRAPVHAVVIPRHASDPQFWRSWEGKMYEYVGMDHNKDPLMKPLDDRDEWKCISRRAFYRTWHPKWRSLCCDRWLNYVPETGVECFHS
jgi:hypothetical protein